MFKRGTLAFIEQNQHCFERSLAAGHITASSWLLSKDGSKALLMYHNKLDKWFQLGGHCDGNSGVLEVAVKEAQEESGITSIAAASSDIFDIDIHTIPENKQEKAHYHYDIRFLLKVTSDEQVAQNHESKALLWIERDLALLPTQNKSIIRMFNKWVSMGQE